MKPVKLLLTVGLILAAILLVVRAASLPTPKHDDAITYLSATCNQEAYATNAPTGEWVSAEVWQSFWQIEQPFCYRAINQGLTNYDIHPPLYFWLLHTWSLLFGVGLTSGAMMNVVIALAAAAAIWQTSRVLGISTHSGAGAAVLWLLSPATLRTAINIRQYLLLGLASILLLLALILFHKHRTPRYAALVGAATLMGLLTHYYFGPVIVAGVMLFSAYLLIRDGHLKAVGMLAASGAAAVIGFIVLHPGLVNTVSRQRQQAQDFSRDVVFYRAVRVVETGLRQIIPGRTVGDLITSERVDTLYDFAQAYTPLVVLGGVSVVLALGITAVVKRDALFASPTYRRLPLVTGLAGVTVLVGLYLSHVGQFHTMGPRYVMILTPVLAVAAGQLFERLPTSALMVAVIVLAGAAVVDTRQYLHWSQRLSAPDVITAGHPILIDNAARGALPRMMWHISPGSEVYVAWQSQMIEDLDFAAIEADTLLYISEMSRHNTREQKTQIFEQLAEQGYERQHVGKVFGVGDVNLLER